MLRATILGAALSVLAAACALVEQPPPAGTRPFELRVVSKLSGPAELTVATPAGALPGAAKPASLPAGSTTVVTFHVPMAGKWTIAVNGEAGFGDDDLFRRLGPCTIWTMELLDNGGYDVHCIPRP